MFFFQFLVSGGRWEHFLKDCPLASTGNRGSGAKNVPGTVLFSILNGHWRYAYINAVRGDGVNPDLLDSCSGSRDVVPTSSCSNWHSMKNPSQSSRGDGEREL